MHDIVYFLTHPTLQGTVARMNRELADGFSALGFRCEKVPYQPESFSEVAAFKADIEGGRVAIIMDLGLYRAWVDQTGSYITRNRIPFFFYGFDNPAEGLASYGTLLDIFPEAFISFTSDDFTAAAPAYLGRRGHFLTLPQAAHEVPMRDSGAIDRFGLLVGNYVSRGRDDGSDRSVAGYDRFWERESPQDRQWLQRMLKLHDAQPQRSLFAIADEIAPQLSVDARAYLIRTFDIRQRVEVRLRALDALIPHEELLVCGQGWEPLAAQSGNVTFLGSTPNHNVLALMGRAQYVINAIPEYYGCSERVIEAAIRGCPVITNRTRFLDSEFGDSFWYFRDAESLRAAIREIRSGEGVQERIAEARRTALARHTWRHRARTIVEHVYAAGFELAPASPPA